LKSKTLLSFCFYSSGWFLSPRDAWRVPTLVPLATSILFSCKRYIDLALEHLLYYFHSSCIFLSGYRFGTLRLVFRRQHSEGAGELFFFIISQYSPYISHLTLTLVYNLAWSLPAHFFILSLCPFGRTGFTVIILLVGHCLCAFFSMGVYCFLICPDWNLFFPIGTSKV